MGRVEGCSSGILSSDCAVMIGHAGFCGQRASRCSAHSS
jgi:hypothetical protein